MTAEGSDRHAFSARPLVRRHVVRSSPGSRPGGGAGLYRGRRPRPVGRRPPGVTVEASSPCSSRRCAPRSPTARVSTASWTCGPAPTPVTFTLPGFSTVKREGIELADRERQRRPARRRRGKTITVTGETPIVDVQSVIRQATISSDVLTSIPTARLHRRDAAGAGHQTQGTSPANVQASPARWSSARPGAQRQRGPAAGGRPGRRRRAQRRRRVGLQRRHRQRAGDHLHRVGRSRRSRSLGADAQRRAQDRRQPAARSVFSPTSPAAWWAATTARSCGRGPGHAGRLLKLWDYTPASAGRSSGSAVVFPEPAQPGRVGLGHVREQERRRRRAGPSKPTRRASRAPAPATTSPACA